MSFIEVTIKGKIGYVRASCVSGVLPDTARLKGSVVYCDPPIEVLAVDETVEEVYAMLYEEYEEEDEDEEEEEEEYEATDQYVTDMMAAWNVKMGNKYLVLEE